MGYSQENGEFLEKRHPQKGLAGQEKELGSPKNCCVPKKRIRALKKNKLWGKMLCSNNKDLSQKKKIGVLKNIWVKKRKVGNPEKYCVHQKKKKLETAVESPGKVVHPKKLD